MNRSRAAILPFIERRVPGLQVLIDANSLEGADGAAISSYTDLKSGYVLPKVGTGNLTLKHNALNGRKELLFAAGSGLDFPAGALGIFNNVPGFTLYAAVRFGAMTTGQVMDFFLAATNSRGVARVYLGAAQADGYRTGARRVDGTTAQVVTSGAASLSSGYAVLAARINYAASDAFLNLGTTQVGASTAFQTDGNTSATDSFNITLGMAHSTSGVNFFSGGLAKMLICNQFHSDTTFLRIIRNLSGQGGL